MVDTDRKILRRRAVDQVLTAVLVMLVLLFAFNGWIAPLDDSLWLDELGTAWVVADGPVNVVDRSAEYHGQSPFYYLLIWGAGQVFGLGEIALRVPSLLFVLTAAALIGMTARRMFGSGAAVAAGISFLVMTQVAFAATDARPYGLALLASSAATHAFYLWLRQGGTRRAVVYAIAAALMLYAHFVFGVVMVGHAFAFFVSGEQVFNPPRRKEALVAITVFALLVVGVVPQIVQLFRRSEQLLIPFNPSEAGFLYVALSTELFLLLTIFAISKRLISGSTTITPTGRRVSWAVAMSAALVPALVLLMLGIATDLVLWQPRYGLVAAPGVALVFAGFVSWLLVGSRWQVAFLIAVTVMGLQGLPSSPHGGANWRGALAEAQALSGDDSTMLLAAGLVEASNPSFLRDPRNSAYLAAPLDYYSVNGDVSHLPYKYPSEGLEDRVNQTLGGLNDDVVVVVNRSPLLAQAVGNLLEDRGFELVDDSLHGYIIVRRYKR